MIISITLLENSFRMNVSKEKSIINAFVDRTDKVRHEKATQMIFYGIPSGGTYRENTYVQSIKKAVRLCYSDTKYRGHFKNIYDTFVSLFYVYLLAKADRLSKIETTLAGYLFIVAKNFANDKKIRNEIEISIGLSDPSAPVDINKIIDSILLKEEGADKPQPGLPAVDEPETEPYWAEYLVDKYIDSIPNENYRTAIRAIVLEGMPREELAEELNTTYRAVNLLVNHAMTALTNVALPDIRWRSRKCFTQYGHLVKDEHDRAILRDYFENNIYHHDLALAVRRLIKISIREKKEQEAEERRELRGQVN